MRPRRPYITTLGDVTINRSGESAVITYRDPPFARWCSPSAMAWHDDNHLDQLTQALQGRV